MLNIYAIGCQFSEGKIYAIGCQFSEQKRWCKAIGDPHLSRKAIKDLFCTIWTLILYLFTCFYAQLWWYIVSSGRKSRVLIYLLIIVVVLLVWVAKLLFFFFFILTFSLVPLRTSAAFLGYIVKCPVLISYTYHSQVLGLTERVSFCICSRR